MHVSEKDKLMERLPKSGQLAAAEADLYEVPAQRQAQIVSFAVCNVAATTSNLVRLYIQTSGGTSRRIFNSTLAAGDTAHLDSMSLAPGTKIRGYATNALQVDWVLTVEEEWNLL